MKPITERTYRSRTDAQWRGARVKSIRPISTHSAKMPAGTVFTVRRKFKGFELVSDPCPHCGVKFRVQQTPYNDVTLVE